MNGLDAELIRAFDTAFPPIAVLIAGLVGAAHGLRPGHGKTMVAAYLIGEHGQRRHAIALALIVAVMHTASVLVLGVLWWFTAGTAEMSIDAVTRWAQVLVAGVVLALGSMIARRRWKAFRSARMPVIAGTGHGHGHGHGPAPDVAPWSRAGLVGIASVGALVPSPSAFLVLISGLLTGRAGLGLLMVAAFGIGLAATVLVTGLVVLAGRDWLEERAHVADRFSSVVRYVPLAGAAAVLTGGLVLSGVALAGVLGS